MRHTRTLLALALATVVASFGQAPSQAQTVATQASPAGSAVTTDAAPSAAKERAATARAKHRFPNRRTAGVPRGWKPQRSVTGDVTVRRAGATVRNLRITNGNLIIDAPNVTVRRVEILGGGIDNFAGSTCHTGLLLKAVTLRRAPGQRTSGDFPTVGVGGYTARRVEILGLSEGFRVGGKGDCGGVRIINSFARIASPDDCGDWHGDAIQGYDGGKLTLRNSVLKLRERDGCGGTAPFFYPSGQGNSSVSIDGLIVEGGGYAFRLGMPGTVRNLHIVQRSWYYGPIDVRCSALSAWKASVSVLRNGGQPVAVRRQRCNSNGGA